MKTMTRRGAITAGIGLAAAAGAAGPWWTPDAQGTEVIVYKSPECGCRGG